jgi:predicted O-methyltransferase YrrM
VPAVPPLVERALRQAASTGFERSCSEATGRLLHALAAQHGRARVGEIGTGVGVGAAWIVSALRPGVPFVTVESDAALAVAAGELFAGDEHVRVVHGDWRDVAEREAPFDLLFVDARPAKADPSVPALLAPGGTAVLDDLTPGRTGADPVRELWLGHPSLAAVELGVSAREAVVVAVRAL